jgi:RES domain-containing protein
LKAYRLHRSRFGAWDTTGALKSGGRWNNPGTPVVYASSSLALSCLEVIVHLRDPELVPLDYVYTEIEVPDRLCNAFPYERGTKGYRAVMESEVLARDWGDRFIQRHRENPSGRRSWKAETDHVRVLARLAAKRLGLAALIPRSRDAMVKALIRDSAAEQHELVWAQVVSPVQAVPSLVIPPELNFLIDPSHPRFRELRWSRPERFEFDPRTLGPLFR